MFNYLLRRLFGSILIIIGVVIITFVMFRVAAGDPAAALLGKNPAPAEVESLRRELGGDLPLFYGHWRTSEVFNLAASERNPVVARPAERWSLKRNFEVPEAVRLTLEGSGVWRCGERRIDLGRGGRQAWIVPPESAVIELEAESAGEIRQLRCQRFQKSGFNSQLFAALRELCSFSAEFPYIKLLDFGKTITTREPIKDILRRGVGASLLLMGAIFIGELLLGITLALIATAHKDHWLDRLLMILSVGMMSVSYLVLIIAGQWFLGYRFNLFPVWGYNGAVSLVLPVIIGIASGLGGSVRFYRTVFVNELNKEYLRTAKGKGCSNRVLFSRHLLANAATPIITHASGILPFLFTGSLLLESFFGIPGLGYAGIDALNNSDLPLLKAITILNALLFVAINLLCDIVCATVDPRIRLA